MGTVEGGAEAVIDGFLDAVGPAGTVAVPTLSQWRKEREKRRVWDLWNIATTPTYCGLIPETFRQAAGSAAQQPLHPLGVSHRIACRGTHRESR